MFISKIAAMSTNAAPQALSTADEFPDSNSCRISTGTVATGWSGSNWYPCPNGWHVSSTGAVSPAARATARIVAVTMPLEAVGRITPRIVRQRATPSASAASRSVPGTRRSDSILARAISGTSTIARAIAAASADGPARATISP